MPGRGFDWSNIVSQLTAERVRKWLIVGILIGIIAGLGAFALYFSINLVTHYVLTGISGLNTPPVGSTGKYVFPSYSRYLIPVSTTLGGLLSGFIVYRFAPEAEGHGTDAAIDAFHNKDGRIRRRIPIVKTIASAITIGSGGSAGREGPTAQVAAGFGSFIADVLHLDDHDRRIAMASGIGAGIGSIFLAPLGGAILSTEILYRRDFEVEALIPSIIASVTGYLIVGYYFHYQSLFVIPTSTVFADPVNLALYLLIGILAGLLGIFYIKVFNFFTALFKKMKSVSVYLRPAIGGLAVGLIAMFLPEVLGLGYGWTQQIFNSELELPLLILVILIFAKIIATSLTIGSGGSGGVFAPGMVIGSFLGITVFTVFHPFFPEVTVAEAAIVSMISFFGGVSKAPISIIIMGTEMTGGFSLFLPIMLATVVSYFITGEKYSIYSKQVTDRSQSPAHADEFRQPLLDLVSAFDGMKRDYNWVEPGMTLREAVTVLRQTKTKAVVVQEDGILMGILSMESIDQDKDLSKMAVSEVMDTSPAVLKPDETLHKALDILSRSSTGILVVADDQRRVLGTVGFAQLAESYNREVRKAKFTPP